MSKRLNEEIVKLMDELSSLMLKKGEQFNSRAYEKAAESIMLISHDILNIEQLKGTPSIGSNIFDKLSEYISTGTLQILEKERNNPIYIFSEIYGVGPKKAKEIVDSGISSLEQLYSKQDDILNDIQKIGLKYYSDVLKRIPRQEIENYKVLFDSIFDKVKNKYSDFEIVGSYRRGHETSGDIDVIITSDDPKVFVNFIDILIKQKVILEVLSRGKTKCLVMARIPSSKTVRRVDFLYTNLDEYPFSILYFTGSKSFNTVMRGHALHLGFTMNEHGIYKILDNKKTEKVNYTFKTERDIFDYLNMEYKEPKERIDGRSVQLKSSLQKMEKMEKEDSNILLFIKEFKKNGISVLEKLNETQISEIIKLANAKYYNSTPLMSDNQYDIIQNYVVSRFPSNKTVLQIGATVERNKVKLPYPMGSMNKIKADTNALISWTKKYNGPYNISCKLDGVSGLYSTEEKCAKLYTRGDGNIGQDISHLIDFLKLPKNKNIVIRGEFILPKNVFEEKYKDKFANARNLVSGIINQKHIDEKIKDIKFVAYEVIKPEMKPSEQMNYLSQLNIDYVLNKNVSNLSNVFLSDTLIEWREKYTYEMDGIIITDDKIYKRLSGNPDHSFAFKMVLSEQIAESKVVDVLWTPSKDGYLKPRVQIEPIILGGVKIEYATGFNGAFIKDNKIGIGAIIELIRSGDVIPHIRKVVVQSEEAKMPDVPYKWTSTNVDIILEDISSDETVKEKNITCFFKSIEVEGLGSGNVSRIIQANFDTVPKILKMSIDDFLLVEGFKIKMATKVHDNIREAVEKASLITIMSATNLFGRGFNEKRLELILDVYPDILISTDSPENKIKKISEIKGLALKTAQAFVEKIPTFMEFMKEGDLMDKLGEKKEKMNNSINIHNPLYNKSIVMTGFRDKELEIKLKSLGAKLTSTVSKNTFVVLIKSKDSDESNKTIDAKKLKIPIATLDVFKNSFHL